MIIRLNLLYGISGHAGLFSTLDDLTQFANVFLNGGKYKNECFSRAAKW